MNFRLLKEKEDLSYEKIQVIAAAILVASISESASDSKFSVL